MCDPTLCLKGWRLNPSASCPAAVCNLCGSPSSVVCPSCDSPSFCDACDDLYHRHPSRASHKRDKIQKSKQGLFFQKEEVFQETLREISPHFLFVVCAHTCRDLQHLWSERSRAVSHLCPEVVFEVRPALSLPSWPQRSQEERDCCSQNIQVRTVVKTEINEKHWSLNPLNLQLLHPFITAYYWPPVPLCHRGSVLTAQQSMRCRPSSAWPANVLDLPRPLFRTARRNPRCLSTQVRHKYWTDRTGAWIQHWVILGLIRQSGSVRAAPSWIRAVASSVKCVSGPAWLPAPPWRPTLPTSNLRAQTRTSRCVLPGHLFQRSIALVMTLFGVCLSGFASSALTSTPGWRWCARCATCHVKTPPSRRRCPLQTHPCRSPGWTWTWRDRR